MARFRQTAGGPGFKNAGDKIASGTSEPTLRAHAS
jgi:hypothetical protein